MSNNNREMDGCAMLVGGTIGFAAGAVLVLLNLPRQIVEYRERFLGASRELSLTIQPRDPVAESIESGKAVAQRRQAELQNPEA